MGHQHSHHHHHHNHHSHHHSSHGDNYDRAFVVGLILNTGFVVVEATAGFIANSLSLIADAGHNCSDVFSLLLAFGASRLARRLPTPKYTYGLRRASILAALINAVALLLVIGAIALEAIQRFIHPAPVDGGLAIAVASVGIVINALTALMFAKGSHADINIRGAFLHMAGDALVSLGVVLAGIAIILTKWLWVDPAVSLVIGVVIVASTWQLLRESVNLALDGVPSGIELAAVRLYLSNLPGVAEVHDLHVWAMSTTETALTVHLVIPESQPGDAFLAQVGHELRDRFGINHSTIQLETGDPDHPCGLASDQVV